MTRRLGSAAAAAMALAGAVAAVIPQHAAALVLLAAGTVAVVAAGYLLVLSAPMVAAEPPVTSLDLAPGPGAPVLEPQGLRDARRHLAARRRADPAAAAELVCALLEDAPGGTR